MAENDNQERDVYLSDAKDAFMKELVDFRSREDFDKFMSNLENNYFESVVQVSKSPYDNDEIPEWPPKPY